MEGKSLPQREIDTRIVRGFLDAGKTSYIEDSITHDFFHKYGQTLVIAFEEGEKSYDEGLLSSFRTDVVYVSGEEDPGKAVADILEKMRPDRLYLEMNCMRKNLLLPEAIRVTFQLTLFDWNTCPLYISNMPQIVADMVRASDQVIFWNCPSREELKPYSRLFRSLNQGAQYLRRDSMGYHEKAFDLFLPYSLEEPVLEISEKDYLCYWLDAKDHPEHYEGKELVFTDPLYVEKDSAGKIRAGRTVMTCCMSDLQFMGIPIEGSFESAFDHGKDRKPVIADAWILVRAKGEVIEDSFRQKQHGIKLLSVEKVKPPKEMILRAV